ncbi:hypothetical protein QOZ80_4BG0329650 [Eleusine coracana subsp. coracana]|nr:hypothetical protein QOZ80_4BG0329650 [Eleusine coracana subsp. coracana]
MLQSSPETVSSDCARISRSKYPTGHLHLPALPANVSSNCTCLLSDKPGSSFVALLLDDSGPVLWYYHCSNNNDSDIWARHEYDIGTQILHPDETQQQEKLVITPVAACGGKVYFSTSFEELGVIDFSFFSTEVEPVAFSSMAMAEVVADGYGVADSARVFMVESEGGQPAARRRLLPVPVGLRCRRLQDGFLDAETG